MGGIILFFNFNSCKPDDPTPEPEPEKTGKLTLKFAHHVDGAPLQIDTMMYVNEAGNQYEVSEVQYFISDITLKRSDGKTTLIKAWKDKFYVDNDMPSTMTAALTDNIPVGNYESISFTFGISKEKNNSFMYTNPPESNMFWPEYLGGGYHYLKLNGWWMDTLNQRSPFNFHIGIGQVYDTTGTITGFIHNDFNVTLPTTSFKIEENTTREMQIVMNIESWFKTPHVWDHNYWSGFIMQNEEAMKTAAENGFDVFTIGYIQ